MKKLVIITALTLAGAAHAQCFGSAGMYTCHDQRTGSTYNVQQIGGTTQMQGHNPNTGSNWSQSSQTVGNTTFNHGTASNGNTWNSTTIDLPGGYSNTTGTNSRGRGYSRTCGPYGCY